MKLRANQEKQAQARLVRAREVLQDDEYMSTGNEKGTFINNPLMLDGQSLDYSDFSLQSAGKLTVHKGTGIHGHMAQVPFYIYLKRDGNKVSVPGNERGNVQYTEVEIADILLYAEHGDQLVIEAVNNENGAIKRILKVLGRGC